MFQDFVDLTIKIARRQKKQTRLALISVLIGISAITATFAVNDIISNSVEDRLLLIVLYALIIFTGIATIVVAMNNIVIQRTSQFGIMKVVGASNKQLLMLMLIESSIIGILGGLGGIISSVSVLTIFTAITQTEATISGLNIARILFILVIAVSTGVTAGYLGTKNVIAKKPSVILRE